MLEADLYRSEAKLDALRHPDDGAQMRYRRGDSGEIVAEEKDEVPQCKEEGAQRWRKELELMFLRGDDPEFSYAAVDENKDYDSRSIEEQEEEDKYFDEEEPAWIASQTKADNEKKSQLMGETGVQDF